MAVVDNLDYEISEDKSAANFWNVWNLNFVKDLNFPVQKLLFIKMGSHREPEAKILHRILTSHSILTKKSVRIDDGSSKEMKENKNNRSSEIDFLKIDSLDIA